MLPDMMGCDLTCRADRRRPFGLFQRHPTDDGRQLARGRTIATGRLLLLESAPPADLRAGDWGRGGRSLVETRAYPIEGMKRAVFHTAIPEAAHAAFRRGAPMPWYSRTGPGGRYDKDLDGQHLWTSPEIEQEPRPPMKWRSPRREGQFWPNPVMNSEATRHVSEPLVITSDNARLLDIEARSKGRRLKRQKVA